MLSGVWLLDRVRGGASETTANGRERRAIRISGEKRRWFRVALGWQVARRVVLRGSTS